MKVGVLILEVFVFFNYLCQNLAVLCSINKSRSEFSGEVLGAAENYLEDAHKEDANEGLIVPLIIGLPCFETGSPGISGGKKSQSFKIKEVATIVNEQERPLISSSIQNTKVE